MMNRIGLVICFVVICSALSSASIAAEDDTMRYIEQKKAELDEREAAVKREEERIAALRREADQRIEKYTKLLAKIENALKKLEAAKTERMQSVVKLYEAMPPEEAAARISELDEETALVIIKGMKSRKAGVVMSFMEPKKAAELTHAMAQFSEGD